MRIQMRILIVDDEKINRDLLTNLLNANYKIMVAKNGEQALKAAFREDGQPDLILLDIMMPEMDGYEVCRRLKAEESTRQIPIIFVTAMGSITDEIKGFDLGAADYITKPFSPPVVHARVRTHLRLKHKSDLLERLASLDGLTEIPNRRAFDGMLKSEWERSKRFANPLSVISIDIDQFKQYNDHYGHNAGDDCLKLVAGALTGIIQRSGDIVARYGGEEFCALLSNTELEGARKVAERLRASVADLGIPHADSRVAPHVTISLGVASVIPEKNHPCQELQKLADDNLYQAKKGGRNQVVGEKLER